jgi:Domain of unknown function (DUF1851)
MNATRVFSFHEAGQCYGFKVPPLFGGEYAPENIAPIDLAQNYAFLADIWSQTRDMPDGTSDWLSLPTPIVIRRGGELTHRPR